MAKKVIGKIKLQLPAGNASPSPPVGPSLGQHGVNIGEFCQQFNARTKDKRGMIIPAEITIYQNRTFSFITKTPPAAILLKKEAGLAKGSSIPNSEKVGKITKEQVEKIAKIKQKDLNAKDLEGAVKIISGTARSMGIVVSKE